MADIRRPVIDTMSNRHGQEPKEAIPWSPDMLCRIYEQDTNSSFVIKKIHNRDYSKHLSLVMCLTR